MIPHTPSGLYVIRSFLVLSRCKDGFLSTRIRSAFLAYQVSESQAGNTSIISVSKWERPVSRMMTLM
jgi:hypothetical protein